MTKAPHSNLTIRSRLLGLMLAGAIPPLLLAVVLLVQGYTAELDRARAQTLETARALRLAVDRELDGRIRALEVLATSRPLRSGDLQAFRSQTEEVLSGQPPGANLILADHSGQQLVNTLLPEGSPLPKRSDLQTVSRIFSTGKPVVSDLIIGAVSRRPSLGISVPVVRDEQVAYDLTLGLPASAISDLLARQRIPEGWTVSIVDGDGTHIARNRAPERFVGQPATPSLAAMLAEGQEGAGDAVNLEGTPLITAFSRSEVSNWSVAIGLPRATVTHRLQNSLLVIAGGGLLLMLLAALVARKLAGRISGPIRTLTDAARAVSLGEPFRPQPSGLAEVDEVAAALALAADARKESEQRLLIAQRIGGIGTFELNQPMPGQLIVSDEFCRLWGVAPRRFVSLVELAGIIHPDDREMVGTIRGETTTDYLEYRIIRPDTGEERWLARRGEFLADAGGGPMRLVGISYDITERKRVEEALRERTRALEIVNRTAAAMAAELDLDRLVQSVTDAGVALTGAQFGAFFYNVDGPDGGRYMLFALSGAPREAFAAFPMPRNTGVFGPTFAGEGIVRCDDITRDPRYGRNEPHYGMPEGHLPVRSYMAVPVRLRSGEVIGGLLFGHSEPGMFSVRSEESLMSLAAQAAVAMDNVRLFQEAQGEILQRKAAEEQLRQLNEGLEGRVVEEIAVRQKAEEQLRHAQKMEAVGQLTGGVAHDFNNLLQALAGCLSMVGRRTQEPAVRPLLEAGQQAVDRGAKLVQQLMAFARRESLRPEPVDVGAQVHGMSELLRRALRADIELAVHFAPGLWAVEVDPTQFELALINLAVNARDAMPAGGTLTIAAENAVLRPGDPSGLEGEFVRVQVTDTGSGMPAEVAARAFEPFFTTKEVGKGSGLGLAQVYGLARQAGGTALIGSNPGQGTTVSLLMRRCMRVPRTASEPVRTATSTVRRSGRVLLVEDDPDVASTAAVALEDAGYEVMRAATADEAYPLLADGTRIDLLFSDVVMPGRLNGVDLAREAQRLRPELPVLLTTGYSEDLAQATDIHLLRKPYQLDDLLSAVDAVTAGKLPA